MVEGARARPMKRISFTLALALTAGCGSSDEREAVPNDSGSEASANGSDAGCSSDGLLPSDLVCTGLYADIATKQLSPRARPYAPATPLWSDGAEKKRWIDLPDGTQIDTSNPGEWAFPVGTKLWKEFSKGGKRVETRVFQKVRPDQWLYATYAWNADESTAVRSPGGDVDIGGGVYHIPTAAECNMCHRGRVDHILGFEPVSLGLPGATGLTLATLAAENRLSQPPAQVELTVGDDGTGVDAPALRWLHVNCGTSCHNANPNATAYSTGLRMRLDATNSTAVRLSISTHCARRSMSMRSRPVGRATRESPRIAGRKPVVSSHQFAGARQSNAPHCNQHD